MLLFPGQVAQSVERAAENRKVGGSIPSLPTRLGQVNGLRPETSPLDDPQIEALLRHLPSPRVDLRGDGRTGLHRTEPESQRPVEPARPACRSREAAGSGS